MLSVSAELKRKGYVSLFMEECYKNKVEKKFRFLIYIYLLHLLLTIITRRTTGPVKIWRV